MAACRLTQLRRCLFAKTPGRDPPLHLQANACKEDLNADPGEPDAARWQPSNLVSASHVSTYPHDINMEQNVHHNVPEPEPTLRDILTAMIACNSLIADLTGEVKGKNEI